MGRRRKAREIALQVLFEIDTLGIEAKEAIDLFWCNFEAPKEARNFSTCLIEGVYENRDEIDKWITNSSDNWALNRMSRVDRNILRIAVFEFLHCHDVPPKVTLNEAIDLGKEFGSENSGSFINGILDALYAKLQKDDGNKDRNGNIGLSEP
jgi:N utilization substance protein B